MKKSSTLNTVLGVLLIAILVVASIFGYRWYQAGQVTAQQVAAFSDAAQSVSDDAPAHEHVAALSRLRALYAGYEKEGLSPEARQKFGDLETRLQSGVEGAYRQELDGYLVASSDTVEDPAVLSEAVTKLEAFVQQLDADASTIAKPTLTTAYRTEASEAINRYTARIGALEEAKRKAEEEATRKAEEERKKAEEEAQKKAAEAAAQTILDTEHFTVDLDDSLVGQWDWTYIEIPGPRPDVSIKDHEIFLKDGSAGTTLRLLCGQFDMEGPVTYLGRPTPECRLFMYTTRGYPEDLGDRMTITVK